MKSTLINLGPQHPASHGVSRLILELQGEYIKNLDSQIGYLHRGTEKLSEYREHLKILPYFDRLDYVSCISMEESYSLSIENLINWKINKNINKNRGILVELGRIQNHLLAITTNAMDIGWITPFLWFFEIREDICNILEEISGARMHVSIIRPGGISVHLSKNIFLKIENILKNLKIKLNELEQLLSTNKIWLNRVRGVGIISNSSVYNNSLTGVLMRSSGIGRDLRRYNNYGSYQFNLINIPSWYNSDINSRVQLRIEEMYISIEYIKKNLSDNYTNQHDNIFNINSINKNNNMMEYVINHFKDFTENKVAGLGKLYHWVESPKGEFGVILINNMIYNRLSRMKIRTPGFFHIQWLSSISKNKIITDCLAILGSFDIVLGEIDR